MTYLPCFPVLGTGDMYLLWALIGSLDCFLTVVIGQSNNFGFGFTTLKRKPLYVQSTYQQNVLFQIKALTQGTKFLFYIGVVLNTFTFDIQWKTALSDHAMQEVTRPRWLEHWAQDKTLRKVIILVNKS